MRASNNVNPTAKWRCVERMPRRCCSIVTIFLRECFVFFVPPRVFAEPVDLDEVKVVCQKAAEYLVSQQWGSGCIQELHGRKRFFRSRFRKTAPQWACDECSFDHGPRIDWSPSDGPDRGRGRR